MKIKESNLIQSITILLIIVTIAIVGFNTLQIGGITAVTAKATDGSVQKALSSNIVPTGVPGIYGQELEISYDDVSPYDQDKADLTIRKLSLYDQNIELTGSDKERYINVLYVLENGISCEYCCGARSIIFENGDPACGCAHSYAMRGLAKYLITEHGSEYTDSQLLEEIGKWKTLFFPSQIQQKADILIQNSIEINYINLASNKYRGIEQGASGGGMVGGC